jgi:hypothetical protein
MVWGRFFWPSDGELAIGLARCQARSNRVVILRLAGIALKIPVSLTEIDAKNLLQRV